MNKTQLLDAAKAAVADRGKTYGTPRENHERIARIWSAILGFNVTPEEVVLCMIGVKQARLIETPGHEDSVVDIAGYAAVYAEVVEAEEAPSETVVVTSAWVPQDYDPLVHGLARSMERREEDYAAAEARARAEKFNAYAKRDEEEGI